MWWPKDAVEERTSVRGHGTAWCIGGVMPHAPLAILYTSQVHGEGGGVCIVRCADGIPADDVVR